MSGDPNGPPPMQPQALEPQSMQNQPKSLLAESGWNPAAGQASFGSPSAVGAKPPPLQPPMRPQVPTPPPQPRTTASPGLALPEQTPEFIPRQGSPFNEPSDPPSLLGLPFGGESDGPPARQMSSGRRDRDEFRQDQHFHDTRRGPPDDWVRRDEPRNTDWHPQRDFGPPDNWRGNRSDRWGGDRAGGWHGDGPGGWHGDRSRTIGLMIEIVQAGIDTEHVVVMTGASFLATGNRPAIGEATPDHQGMTGRTDEVLRTVFMEIVVIGDKDETCI